MAVNTDSISRRALGVSPTTSEYPYQGIQHCRDIVYKEAAESKHPYVIFSNIDEQTFLHDFDDEQSYLYSDFFPQLQVLLAKMPATQATEGAHLGIHNTLIMRLAAMNIRHQLRSLGRTDVMTPSRIKQPTQSYKPRQIPASRSTQWPSVLIQSAYSEAESKLASDARWWLNASGGEVETVLTISVWKRSKGITFEKWDLISRPTRGDPERKVPKVVQKVVVSEGVMMRQFTLLRPPW